MISRLYVNINENFAPQNFLHHRSHYYACDGANKWFGSIQLKLISWPNIRHRLGNWPDERPSTVRTFSRHCSPRSDHRTLYSFHNHLLCCKNIRSLSMCSFWEWHKIFLGKCVVFPPHSRLFSHPLQLLAIRSLLYLVRSVFVITEWINKENLAVRPALGLKTIWWVNFCSSR